MVFLIQPQGYCMGVKRALNLLDDVLENNYPKPIYLLGKLIHNDIVMEKYQKAGIIILNENNKEEELMQIETGTIVFQAHGTNPKLYDLAKKKGLSIVDATCPFVNLIHKKINEYVKNGFDIIYLGKNHHSESEAALTLAPNIHFITALEDVSKLNITNKSIYVTNQTTLSSLDLANIYKAIQIKFPTAVIDNKICQATLVRQEAVLGVDADLIIVVGDNHSSNTKRLFELAKSKTKAIYANSLVDIKNTDFTKFKKIGITSGASTPDYIVEEIFNYLQNLIK